MRILKLINNKIEPVEAIAQFNKKKDKDGKFGYTIQHGSFGNGLWTIKTYLHTRHFPLGKPGTKIKLDEDNYTFSAIHKDGKPVKDQRGNNIYIISKDQNFYNLDTIILFWNLPIIPNAEISYAVFGSARIIAEGTHGVFHVDHIIKIPAPVLDITGDCTLECYAKDIPNNTLITQTISYDSKSDRWEAQPKQTEKLKG